MRKERGKNVPHESIGSVRNFMKDSTYVPNNAEMRLSLKAINIQPILERFQDGAVAARRIRRMALA
ncbi:hypothetical protein V1477_012084 [Vespula maculifrons]|uniref:Uncharacterized protein n=1 Tax=Vespula maculifrons TaxID=7453 RepID=A0ABD2BWH9_VESMC